MNNKDIKSLKRQLMAAVAMCLAAAVALGSSTYAWFASNNRVVAEGITVNAVSESAFLQIKGTDSGETYSTVGTSTVQNTSMKPATSADGINFGKLADGVSVTDTGSSVATWTGQNGAFQAADLVLINDNKDQYVATATYTLKCTQGSASNVYVSEISVQNPSTGTGSTTDTKDIYKSIRIAVACDNTTLIFNPNGEGYNNSEGAGKYDNNTWSLQDPAFNNTNQNDGKIADTIASDGEKEVTVSVWFEGQDNNCFTDNVPTEGISISLAFTAGSTSSN